MISVKTTMPALGLRDPKDYIEMVIRETTCPLATGSVWEIMGTAYEKAMREWAKDADEIHDRARQVIMTQKKLDKDKLVQEIKAHEDKEKKDLPTLKVLGWDGRDTPLHLDSVARELAENLSWPDDEEDAETWKKQWSSAFTLRHRETITTSKNLAEQLAELARGIRDRINTVLAIETEDGPVSQLMQAFKDALVDDLDQDGFGDPSTGVLSCSYPSGLVNNANDCNDLDATVYPAAPELCDGLVNACGGTLPSNELDLDIDAYVSCAIDFGWITFERSEIPPK